MVEMIRVLVADDHPLFRSGMRALLAADPDTEVAGEATTGEEAIALALALQPDIVLMDLQMPGLSGVDATRRILHASPNTRILVVTMFDDDHSVFAAMRAGARGYLLKDAALDEVVRAVTAVARGEAIFSPAIAQRLMGYFGRAHSSPPAAFPDLTDREYEILTLIAQRRSNPEIAARLVLSPKTVRNHVSNILSKLQVADRAEAMMAARAAGLGHDQT